MDEKLFDRPLEEQLCFEIYKASISFAKMYSRALKPYGLTFPQYLVLLALWDKEEVRMKELQERLGVSIGTLHPIVNHLEKDGWVQKQKSSADKRAVNISLTSKAQKQKGALLKSLLEEVKDSRVDDIDFESLFLNLRGLNQELGVLESIHAEHKTSVATND